MSTYRFVAPPLRDWPRLWRGNVARLYRATFLANPVGRAVANLAYLPGSDLDRAARSLREQP